MSHLSNQLVDITHRQAITSSLVSKHVLNAYQKAVSAAENYNKRGGTAEHLDAVRRKLNRLSEGEKVQLSRLMALETVVLNAVQNFENARTLRCPQERFADLFRYMVQKALNPQESIERLIETKDKMLVSLVHTMHPTIYHTPEARKLEWDLSEFLEEKIACGFVEPRLVSASLNIFKTRITEAAGQLHAGTITITPLRQMRIPEENATERENLARIQSYIYTDETEMTADNRNIGVVNAWNQAVDCLDASSLSGADIRDRLRISAKDRVRMFEIRTWGRGADADGREKSNAIQLAQTIGDNIHNGRYIGPILDLRQNAEVHTNLVSALIQVLFRKSDGRGNISSQDGQRFAHFCEKFINSINTPEDWRSPTQSVYQELANHKPDFARKLLVADFQLIPDIVRAQALSFTQMYAPLYRKFLAEHNLPETTTFDELSSYEDTKDREHRFSNLKRKFQQWVKDQEVEITVNGTTRKIDFFITEDGLQFQPDNYEEPRDFLDGRVKPDPDGEHIRLSREERGILLDVAKRLFVINDAISRFGAEVADRHQIANFGGTDGFYEAMLLFKEAGLITIDAEQERVTHVKMGIMPLLETLEDMQVVRKTFRQLLDDPLVHSYYDVRGVAEFMLGFSDGAKSAGNFAGEWQIYKTARDLTVLFAEYGIRTRFFEGRGRGYDRGGPGELGQSTALMPDIMNVQGYKDMTVQADLPMDMAGSPFYGRDQLASIMVGVAAGREKALTRTEGERQRISALETALDFIAEKAATTFQQVVRYNPDTADFIIGMPKNAFISSRKGKREATIKQDYEAVRAIENEYAANFADLPYHNVGLKEALKAFSESGIQVPDAKGRTVSGEEALQALRQHPFFETIMRKLEASLHNYDSVIAAEIYGEKTNTRSFVDAVIRSLDGSIERVRQLLHGDEQVVAKFTRDKLTEPQAQRLDALDITAHALVSTMDAMNPDGKHYPQQQEIINNTLFTKATEISHRDKTVESHQVAQYVLG